MNGDKNVYAFYIPLQAHLISGTGGLEAIEQHVSVEVEAVNVREGIEKLARALKTVLEADEGLDRVRNMNKQQETKRT